MTACQHSSLSQHGMLTHDFYYFKMNTDNVYLQKLLFVTPEKQLYLEMPKTCFAHHIQAQFGQMSGAFAVIVTLDCVGALAVCCPATMQESWVRQIGPNLSRPNLAEYCAFLASHNVTVAASLAGGASKGLQKIWILTWCLCDNTIAYIRLQLTCPTLVALFAFLREFIQNHSALTQFHREAKQENQPVTLLPCEKCEEYQSRPIRNKRWVVEYILVPETIMNILFC